MPLTELRKLIERFKQQKDDTPISLSDRNARVCAIQEITDMCSSEIHAFIFFDKNGESELFNALSDEKTSRKLSKFLNHSIINIVTNNTSKVKSLSFIERNSVEGQKRLHICPIPNKLANEIIDDTLDNEFFLSSPSHLIFMGRYASPSSERLSEVSSFLNLFELEFYENLRKYFLTIKYRVEKGEFR